MTLSLGAGFDGLEAFHLTGEGGPGPCHRKEYRLFRRVAGHLGFVAALARPLSAFGDTGHQTLPGCGSSFWKRSIIKGPSSIPALPHQAKARPSPRPPKAVLSTRRICPPNIALHRAQRD